MVKNLFSEKNLGQTKFLAKKNLVKIVFGSKKFPVKIIFWLKKTFLLKKTTQNNFSIKEIFGKKKLVQNVFKSFCQKNWVGLTLGRRFMTPPPESSRVKIV